MPSNDDWSADDAQVEVIRRNVQAANERSEALVEKVWDVVLTPLEGLIGNMPAEREQLAAERKLRAAVEMFDQVTEHEYSPASELDADQWDAEFSQAETEEDQMRKVEDCEKFGAYHVITQAGTCRHCKATPDPKRYGWQNPAAYRPESDLAYEEFTQQDHEEYSAYLDEIYQAEQLERTQREADERRDDR